MAVVVVDVVVVLPGSVLPDPLTATNSNITVSAGTTTLLTFTAAISTSGHQPSTALTSHIGRDCVKK